MVSLTTIRLMDIPRSYNAIKIENVVIEGIENQSLQFIASAAHVIHKKIDIEIDQQKGC